MHAKVFSIQIFQHFHQIPPRVCTLVLFIRHSSNVWAGVWPVLFKLLSQRYVIVHVLLGRVVTFGQVSGRFVQAVSQRYVIIHVLLGRVVTFGQVSGRFVQAVKSKICDCSCIIRHSSNVWAGVWPFCSSC